MKKPVPEHVRRFIEAHNTLSLATGDGERPWAASVFYATDDDLNFYFISDPLTRHCLDIGDNLAVSVTINDDFSDWNEIVGVQMTGEAKSVLQADRERVERLFLAKFPAIRDLIEAPQSDQDKIISERLKAAQFYRITPQWLRYIDNSRGFGHKEEFL